jgi:hypothetical protein
MVQLTRFTIVRLLSGNGETARDTCRTRASANARAELQRWTWNDGLFGFDCIDPVGDHRSLFDYWDFNQTTVAQRMAHTPCP